VIFCEGKEMLVDKENQVVFWLQIYKFVSLSLSVIFGIVGIVFLFIPDHVLSFFNSISPFFGLVESPVQGTGLFLILAVAYMYLVTIISFMMYKHPENSIFSFLLINGKLASSVISILLFVVHGHFLIYGANAMTDGSIALGVFLISRKVQIGMK
jgi:hypothetical protein